MIRPLDRSREAEFRALVDGKAKPPGALGRVEDLAVRRWVEASLKANELATATKKALTECAGDIEPPYGDEVEAALQRVQEVVASGSADGQSGDTKNLQAVCAALDEITKPLAELLMDRAMAAVLRKRGLIVEEGPK